jgi:hypothetical protein
VTNKGCPNKNARFERVITLSCVVLSCPIFDRLIVNISELVIMESKIVQQRVSIIKSTHYHFCASIFLVVILSFSVFLTRNGLHDHVFFPLGLFFVRVSKVTNLHQQTHKL